MKTMLLAMAAIASVPSAEPPSGDPFCDDVRALAQAAEEADPFRSLRARDFTPRLARAYCFFSDAGGYTCGHNLATPEETRESYAARIHACLPGSLRTARRDGSRHDEIIRRGRFQARVSERGSDRGHVGRSIDIFISAAPPTGS